MYGDTVCIYKMSMYGFCFMFGIKNLFVMNHFCFHCASQDKGFCLQEEEFVVGSARLEKTFESIESSKILLCDVHFLQKIKILVFPISKEVPSQKQGLNLFLFPHSSSTALQVEQTHWQKTFGYFVRRDNKQGNKRK